MYVFLLLHGALSLSQRDMGELKTRLGSHIPMQHERETATHARAHTHTYTDRSFENSVRKSK